MQDFNNIFIKFSLIGDVKPPRIRVKFRLRTKYLQMLGITQNVVPTLVASSVVDGILVPMIVV